MTSPLLEEVFAKAVEGIGIFSQDGRVFSTNESFLHIFGFSDLEKARSYNLFRDPNFPMELWSRLFEKGEAESSCSYLFYSGHPSAKKGVHDFLFRLRYMSEEQAVLVFVENRTDMKMVSTSLAESEEKFRILSESSPGGMFILQDRGVVYANAEFCRIAGKSQSSLLTEDLKSLIPRQQLESLSTAVTSVLRGTPSQDHISFSIRRGGDPRELELYMGSCVYRGSPSVIGMVVDVSERTRLIRDLHQAEKMQALGVLAGGVAHDFNNLLMGISGYAELLSKKIHNPVLKGYARSILRESAKAGSLTENILAFSHKSRSIRTRVDMRLIFQELREILARTLDPKIRQSWEYEASGHFLLGDVSRLQSALLNLVLNARDAMPEGGRLLIRFTDSEPGHIKSQRVLGSGEVTAGRYFWISVWDSGSGMDEFVQSHLFDSFFSTKKTREGTGLGLSMVYDVVREMEGFIGFDSRVGEGSCFDLYLPMERGAGEEA